MRGVVESARTLRLTSRSDRGVPREAPQGLTKVGSVLYIPFTVVTIRRWEYMEQPLSGRLHAKNVHSKSCQRLVVGSSLVMCFSSGTTLRIPPYLTLYDSCMAGLTSRNQASHAHVRHSLSRALQTWPAGFAQAGTRGRTAAGHSVVRLCTQCQEACPGPRVE